jgi:hypothetical protein
MKANAWKRVAEQPSFCDRCIENGLFLRKPRRNVRGPRRIKLVEQKRKSLYLA